MSEELHSPLAIKIALHYWALPERYAWREPEHAYSRAVREIKAALVEAGLLRALPAPCDDHSPEYEAVNEAMSLYVDALCRVPWPVKRWVMP